MGADRIDDEDDLQFDGEPPPAPRRWSSAAQMVAAILWPSFLAASLATMVFFAVVDPELIHESTAPPLELSRTTGYGLGFFFFWFVTTAASALTAYLLRTAAPAEPPDPGPRPRS